MAGCRARVFDGYMEWDDCESPTVGATDLCKRHLIEKIETLKKEVEKLESDAKRTREEYQRMLIELETHTGYQFSI